jgi:uncharacterized Ntn-hydrolase superfamily protein
MTYAVIGRCDRTNQIGIAVATYSLVCGSFTQGGQTAYGVSMSQANVRKGNAPLANQLFAHGFGARSVLGALVKDDEYAEYRQIGVMSRSGEVAVHTGNKVAGWCGDLHGPNYLVFGNLLVGGEVVQAMKEGFFQDPALPLQERLLASLEFGSDAGGQGSSTEKLAERSASLTVVDRRNAAEWDIRVDLHPRAVKELRRIYESFAPYQPYYNDRDTDPSRCLPQAQWEKTFLERPAF